MYSYIFSTRKRGHCCVSPEFRFMLMGSARCNVFLLNNLQVIKYESVIHEFDPYFNYRVTQVCFPWSETFIVNILEVLFLSVCTLKWYCKLTVKELLFDYFKTVNYYVELHFPSPAVLMSTLSLFCNNTKACRGWRPCFLVSVLDKEWNIWFLELVWRSDLVISRIVDGFFICQKKEKEKEKKKKYCSYRTSLKWLCFFLKVSSRSCYWWNCLPWIDIDRRNPMEVGIWKYNKELNTIDFVPPFWFWIWCILL